METRIEDKILLDHKTREIVRAFVPSREHSEKLCDFLSALGEGTRIKILSALAISDMCVNDMSALLALNQTTLSHQHKILRSVGVVGYRRQGKISFYYIRNKKVLDILSIATDCV